MADLDHAASLPSSPPELSSPENDAVGLSNTLQFCSVSYLHEYALQIPPSEADLRRYDAASRRYNSTGQVLSQADYWHEAFGLQGSERMAYDEVFGDALSAGVPTGHLVPWQQASSSWWVEVTPLPGGPHRSPAKTETPLPPRPTSRKAASARTSSAPPRTKLSKGVTLLVQSSRPSSDPLDPRSSVPSLASTNSQASHTPLTRLQTRRDGLKHFWRRPGAKRASDTSEIATAYDILDALDGSHSVLSFNSRADTSIITPPPSRGSSGSTPAGLELFSTTDRDLLLEAIQSTAFVAFRRSCDQMAIQFLEHALIAKSALSLLCARFLCTMDRHIKHCIQDEMKTLEEKYDAEMDALETRQAAKELQVKDMQKVEKDEMAERNAIALKHVNRRLRILGDAATYEDKKRLFEEQEMMNELSRKHARDLASLCRTHERQRLDLERKQQNQLGHVHTRFQAKFDSRIAPRYPRLKDDMAELTSLLRSSKNRLLARWYIQLQKFKAETASLSNIEAALPLNLLTISDEFMAF